MGYRPTHICVEITVGQNREVLSWLLLMNVAVAGAVVGSDPARPNAKPYTTMIMMVKIVRLYDSAL